MTNSEKNNLSKKIRQLSTNSLKGILKILRGMYPEKNGVVEFDLNKLPSAMLYKLDQYVKEKMEEEAAEKAGVSIHNLLDSTYRPQANVLLRQC